MHPDTAIPQWSRIAAAARESTPDAAVNGVRDALDYLCLAQLYLRDNPRTQRPLTREDIKPAPSGHWGVCPPVNAVLAALGPLQRATHAPHRIDVLHGAGHAAPSALAHSYLTGRLGTAHPALTRSAHGLHTLVTGFPHPDLGTEITPLIPGHLHTGGQLGPALAIAQGTVLDAPHRLAVVLIGDGECETGATAAAWLGRRALHDTGTHGTVLPVVLLNGQRMGGPSLLAGLTRDELDAYFTGLGHHPVHTDATHTPQLRDALDRALELARPLHATGPTSVLIVTLPKGHGAPHTVDGHRIAGTPAVHKTPLPNPRDNPEQLHALTRWLAGYRPTEILTPDGHPAPALGPALPTPPIDDEPLPAPRGCIATGVHAAHSARSLPDVLDDRAAQGPFRVFSPDELASNRLTHEHGRIPDWACEILNEELCHAWAQGYTETGRHALVATYEAFAPVNTSLLVQQLKHRAVRRHAGLPALPSIVYLLTSLGWHNTFTHQNPGLVTTALATGDPTVHVLTPADPDRAAANLTIALRKLDRCTLLVTGKHPLTRHPTDTLETELRHGIARWPHLSDPGEPDLVLASAGDLPAHQLTALAGAVHHSHPHARVRYLHINDLTVLGEAGTRPLALADDDTFTDLFTTHAPIVLATTGNTADIHALLGRRHPGPRLHVRGYNDPGRPTTTRELARHSGLDIESLTRLVTELLDRAQ
ncbi:phosphoketolase [Embleya sp. MST-111070]|uniref:phosphoketolase family protein n=1 Tax=Embleya sp. MST-111070 TaxID=3398231 RepID=UPI003F7384E2